MVMHVIKGRHASQIAAVLSVFVLCIMVLLPVLSTNSQLFPGGAVCGYVDGNTATLARLLFVLGGIDLLLVAYATHVMLDEGRTRWGVLLLVCAGVAFFTLSQITIKSPIHNRIAEFTLLASLAGMLVSTSILSIGKKGLSLSFLRSFVFGALLSFLMMLAVRLTFTLFFAAPTKNLYTALTPTITDDAPKILFAINTFGNHLAFVSIMLWLLAASIFILSIERSE